MSLSLENVPEGHHQRNYERIRETVNANAIPVGSVFLAPTATIPQGGYLVADGTDVSRLEYEDLFAVLGTTYGPGDGVTTFTLPDLSGDVPVGLTSGNYLLKT